MVADTHVTSANDFAGLARLKSLSAEQDPKAIREAARQFEALFLQMMLKSMRDAGSAFAEDRDRSYEEMFDQQIALDLAQRDSIGVADLLMRQIGLGESNPSEAETGIDRLLVSKTPHSTRRREDFSPQTPREFVHEIWPLAQEAGDKLGVDPRAIVAQAALETGWGEKLIRDTRGISGNNLFGIKTGSDWGGEHISVQTLEHTPAGFAPRQAQFRAYPTLEAGFAGYVDFLQSSPRYRSAIEQGNDADAFAAELQSAGYATDPDYENKIRSILSGSRLSEYLGDLSNGG